MSDRVNGVSGLERFREQWDARKPREGHVFENATSAEGHINIEGSARCLSSVIFTPADPEFLSAIEPGVRPLVTVLIERLGCITYSSCEGHPPAGEYPMRGRHVGILPRDDEEHARLVGLLSSAAEAACTPSDREVVDLQVREDVIAGDQGEVRCIDVLFVAGSLDWDAYSSKIDSVTQAYLSQLATAVGPSRP